MNILHQAILNLDSVGFPIKKIKKRMGKKCVYGFTNIHLDSNVLSNQEEGVSDSDDSSQIESLDFSIKIKD